MQMLYGRYTQDSEAALFYALAMNNPRLKAKVSDYGSSR